MPRAKREDYPGAWHHVMNHCLKFMDILGKAVERFGIEIHAYSLMPNHYHLLIRTMRNRENSPPVKDWIERLHAEDKWQVTRPDPIQLTLNPI
jgi:hypothetical protein